MGKFVFYVSCFVNCHNSVMCVVVAVVSKNYLLNDHTRTNIFNFHNNAYIILQGGGGIKGWDLILHIVYLSRRLRSRAVEYFSCWTLSAWINAGELCGTLWTHILLSCPSIYTIHSVLIFTYIRLISCLYHAYEYLYLAYIMLIFAIHIYTHLYTY